MAVLYLRKAEKKDLVTVFTWRNLPEVYAMGRQNRPVMWREHQTWFDKVVDSDQYILLVIEPRAGMVRFDRENEIVAISVYLLPEYRGQGYGPGLIREACVLAFTEWPFIKEVNAVIKKANRVSIKAFRKAGFQDCDSSEGGYIRLVLTR